MQCTHGRVEREAEEELLTAAEVGQILRISPRTVLSLPLAKIRVGARSVRFRRSDVLRAFGIGEGS